MKAKFFNMGHVALSVAVFCLFLATSTNAAPPVKVNVCHVPADNPDKTQLIQVGSKGGALADHMSHGDWEATDAICEDDISDNNCDGAEDDPNADNYDCVLQTGNANAFCDNKACRILILPDAELSVESPVGIYGTYPAKKGNQPVSTSFDLSGLDIVPADPLNADTPLNNAVDVAGKIVLIASDGFATSSRTKGNNAAAAGALAAIIYNSDDNSLIAILGSDIIPTILVGKDIGESILANLPVVGGMQELP